MPPLVNKRLSICSDVCYYTGNFTRVNGFGSIFAGATLIFCIKMKWDLLIDLMISKVKTISTSVIGTSPVFQMFVQKECCTNILPEY